MFLKLKHLSKIWKKCDYSVTDVEVKIPEGYSTDSAIAKAAQLEVKVIQAVQAAIPDPALCANIRIVIRS